MSVKEKQLGTMSRREREVFVTPDYVFSQSGEEFHTVLSRYLREAKIIRNINQQDIARETGIDSSTLSKYKKGHRSPTLTDIILLCLAMRLAYERSVYLLYSGGFALNDCEEHRIYKLFLQGCAFNEYYSIQGCNEMLIEKKHTKLSVN